MNKKKKKNEMPKGNMWSSVPLPQCSWFVLICHLMYCDWGSGPEGDDVLVILLWQLQRPGWQPQKPGRQPQKSGRQPQRLGKQPQRPG